MPAKSEAQKRLMDAAAHNPAFAKKVGIPSKVAKDFSEASIGMKFKKDSAEPKAQRQSTIKPSEKSQFSKGGTTMDKEDIKQDKAIIKKAVGMHDKQMHEGKKTNLSKLARGGGIEQKGKTKGTIVKMARGGGIETKGKTKGKMVVMCGGGMAKKK